MRESVKFKKEVERISKEIKDIEDKIFLSDWKISHEEVTRKISKLFFDENIDDYALTQDESNIFYWIKSNHNMRIIGLQGKIERQETPFSGSDEEKNYCNLQALVFNLNEFLVKTKNCNKNN